MMKTYGHFIYQMQEWVWYLNGENPAPDFFSLDPLSTMNFWKICYEVMGINECKRGMVIDTPFIKHARLGPVSISAKI